MGLKVYLAIAGLLVVSGTVRADTVFTERGAFAAAITSDSTTLETWDEFAAGVLLPSWNGITYTPGFGGDVAQVTDFFLSLSPPNTLGAAAVGFFDTGETMTFTFSSPINIFAINFNSFAFGSGYQLSTNTGSVALSAYDPFPSAGSGEFVGLISTFAFTSVTITPLDDPGCGAPCSYTLDDMTYGSTATQPPTVPEPASLLMMASGLAVWFVCKRLRQQ